MKITAISIFLFVLLLSSASAISITEVEINPAGTDAGFEWIEIYSESSIDLSNYYFENNDGGIYNLTGNFTGYFVIQLQSQWLDNTEEKVYLKTSSEVVDETNIFEDSFNDDRAWSICDKDWKFIDSSKNRENDCPVESNNSSSNDSNTDNSSSSTSQSNQTSQTAQSSNNKNQSNQENSQSDNDNENSIETSSNSPNSILASDNTNNDNSNERIILNSKSSSEFSSSKNNLLVWISLSFTALCILIIILFSFRKL